MESLVLKLVVTPLLIALATLVGRRWGPALSGWLIGLPFTSGPVTFFLALSHGTAFAAAAALGTLTGTLSECVFCLSYAWISRRHDWPLTLAASALGFALSTVALHFVTIPAAPMFVIVAAGLVISLRLMPPRSKHLRVSAPTPRWDLPARALLATAFVVALTAVAPALGAQLTGLIAPFPLYASILASFAHAQQGHDAAADMTRGLLIGLFAFASFFLVAALLLVSAGITVAFVVATLTALAVQGASLLVMRRAGGIAQRL